MWSLWREIDNLLLNTIDKLFLVTTTSILLLLGLCLLLLYKVSILFLFHVLHIFLVNFFLNVIVTHLLSSLLFLDSTHVRLILLLLLQSLHLKYHFDLLSALFASLSQFSLALLWLQSALGNNSYALGLVFADTLTQFGVIAKGAVDDQVEDVEGSHR